jgi:hypothetical protein
MTKIAVGCAECGIGGGHALYCVACAEKFVGGYKDSGVPAVQTGLEQVSPDTPKDKALKLALDYIVATNKSSEFWLVPGSNLNKTVTAIKEALAQPAQEPDYAYPTIEEYEEITGFKVNDAFKMGWAMARTTNALFKQMEKNT